MSVTAGQGHNATANAIKAYLESIGVESMVLDTLGYFNKLVGKAVSEGYLLSVEKAREAYALVYGQLEKRQKGSYEMSATRAANMIFVRKMKKILNEYNPDVIVTTHIFASIVVDILISKNATRAKAVGILTDFTFHPFWDESLRFNYIVIPNEQMVHQALKKGYKHDQILPFGIPINPKFMNSTPKEEALRSLGLDPHKKTVLLMSGSMGYGNIGKTVKLLDDIDKDFQLITVCGSNEDAKKEIDSLALRKPILSLGFANNVDLLMDASDCIITKPGGLTTSEALAKRLPMIIVNPIPGQEERNTEFLLNNGAAMAVSKKVPLDDAIAQMFENERRTEVMRDAIDIIRKPDSTKRLCEFIKTI